MTEVRDYWHLKEISEERERHYHNGYLDGTNDLSGKIYGWLLKKHPKVVPEFQKFMKEFDKNIK